MLASGAEVQRFAHSALVHLRDNLPAMALCQPSLSGQFFELLPFIGQPLRQFPVSRFCTPFEPPNPSVTADSIVAGDPKWSFRRLMCVFCEGCHSGPNL